MEKNEMIKNKIFFAICASVAILTLSCNAGLGDSVDTEPPTLSISYPSASAVIMEDFVLAGSCSDDEGVTSVSVSLTNIDKGVSYGTTSATLSSDKKSWSVSLNAKDYTKYAETNGWQLPDGKYTAYVTAFDASGRSSGTSSLAFEIDNTAPVLILSKPLTIGNAANPSSYGRTIKLAGDIGEAHNVSKLILNLREFDSSGIKELKQFTVTDFSQMSADNPLVIADYCKEDEVNGNATKADLRNKYLEIYGSDADNENPPSKKFYCGIQLSDSAKIYRNPGDSGLVSGNTNFVYYINTTEFYDALIKTDTYSLTAVKLMNILNGTGTDYTANQIEKIKEEIAKSEAPSGNTSTGDSEPGRVVSGEITNESSSVFQLNPLNNPHYTISGYEINESNTNANKDDHYYRTFLKSASSLPIGLNAGNDSIYIDPTTVSVTAVYLDFENGQKKIDESKSVVLLAEGSWNDEASLSLSKQITPDSTALTSGKYYDIVVKGSDRNGNDLLPTNSDGYGILVDSNYPAPEIVFSTEEFEKNGVSELDFEGTVSFDNSLSIKEKNVSLKRKNTQTGDITELTSGTDFVVNFSKEESSKKFTLKLKDKNNNFNPATKGRYRYDLTLKITHSENKTGSATFTFYIDNQAPKISISSISPEIVSKDKKYIYGMTSVKFNASDNGQIGDVSYHICKDDGAELPFNVYSEADSTKIVKENVTTYSLGAVENATVYINSDDFKNSYDNINFVITAKDSVDNSITESQKLYFDKTPPTFVNKDKYSFVVNNTKYSATTYSNSTALSFVMYFEEAASGIARVDYWIKDATGTPTGSLSASQLSDDQTTADVDESDYWKVNSSISGFEPGQNPLYLQAVDGSGNKSEISPFTINIDQTSPNLSSEFYTFDSSTYNTAGGQILTNKTKDITIFGKVSDSDSGVASLSCTVNGNLVPATVQYTTDNLSSIDSGESFANLNWANYSEENSKKITAWKATIGSDKINEGAVVVTASDLAGNKVSFPIFTFVVDNTSPKVNISTNSKTNLFATKTLENGTQISKSSDNVAVSSLNGKVTISGTGTDKGTLSSVSLYTSVADSKAEIVSTDKLVDTISYPDAYSWSFEITVSNEDMMLSSNGKCETQYDASSKTSEDAYFKIVATDSASNTSIYVYKYVIEPEGDRPVVTLNTMDSTLKVQNSNISGTVSDDDGIKSLKYKINDNDWTECTVSGSSFKITNLNDGTNKLYFKIEDSAGGEFDSSSEKALLQPVILLSDSKKITGPVDFMVDTVAPTVVIKGLSIDGGKNWISDFTKGFDLGGTTKSFMLKVEASDDNGIASIEVETQNVNAKKYEADKNKTTDSDGYYLINGTDGVDCSTGTGTMIVKVSATDGAGVVSTASISLPVDNTPPSVSIISHTETNNQVNGGGSISMYGSIDTVSAHLYYGISTTAEYEPGDTPVEGKSIEYELLTDSSALSWYLYFDNDTDNTAPKHTYKLNDYLEKLKITTLSDISDNKYTNITPLYIWIKAVDNAGNVSKKNIMINIDPQGDRPSTTIDYPSEDGVTIGGTITVRGNAEDNNAVTSVWVQLISSDKKFGKLTLDNNGKVIEFTPSAKDLDYFASAGYSIYKFSSYKADNPGTKWVDGDSRANESGFNASDYAILATHSGSSWSLKLNEKKELDPSSSTNDVGIKVFAFDDLGNKSIEQYRSFKVDSDNPTFDKLQLVYNFDYTHDFKKYEFDNSKNYEADSYVKGEWSIVGKIHDDDGIESLSIGKTKLIENSIVQNGNWKINNEDTNEIWFAYPLNTGSGDGNVSFEISAWDKAEGVQHEGTCSISVNYDNTAPVLVTSGNAFDISGEVKQSNGFYTFGAQVKEDASGSINQSGFKRVAFYFLRRNLTDQANKTYTIFDPMLNKTNPANRIDIKNANQSSSEIVYDSGLYWKKIEVTRDSDTANVLTLPTEDPNIRKCGLVKIGGSEYTISALSGCVLTLDSAVPFISNTQTAYFALAQIVDNTVTESGSGIVNDDGYYDKPLNDDGDGMVEGVQKSGTTWTWEANICSKNIPDGPIEIHYVAFDAAGNYSIGTVGNVDKDTYASYKDTDKGTCEVADSNNDYYVNASAFVCNNGPRIAGVQVGTDFNGDNTIDEWITTYSAATISKDYVDVDGNYDISKLGSSITLEKTQGKKNALLTTRGFTQVKPEIVGGNGNLYYSFSYPNGSGSTSGNNFNSIGSGVESQVSEDATLISLQIGDLLQVGNSAGNLGNDDNVKFTFDIWDSTEGATTFENTQKATIELYMNVKIKDNEKPTTKINPFYWNSASDNSLYNNSKENGHIELESDWENPSGTGELDSDPKVSGKIVITGTAHDNKMISALYLSVPGMTFGTEKLSGTAYNKMSSYSNGSWTTVGDLSSNGYEFKVTESKFNENGHDVKWTFTWDTSKITYSVALDVPVQILALDQGVPTCATTNDLNASLSVDGKTHYAAATYSEPKQSETTTTQTTKDSETSYYRMDVVPYITSVETSLSTKKKNNPSVYNRTALGHYPVSSIEEFKIKGFNFGTSSVKISDPDGKNTMTVTPSDSSLPVALTGKSLKSGKWTVTVNGIETLNNVNNNDARGVYAGVDDSSTGNYSVHLNYYNRQPNNDNNNRLNDDFVVDVWELNSEAAKPLSGIISNPVMKISPKSKMIGFAFTNGPLNFSMAGKVGDTEYSYYNWQKSFDFMTSTGLAYDSTGYTYGCAAGGDINANDADRFSFMTDRWGISQNDNQYGSYYGRNALRLEAIGQYGDSSKKNTGVLNFDKTRIKNPSYATHRNGSNTDIYLAYFDNLNGEIRFRAGTLEDNQSKTNFGNFVDGYTENTVKNDGNLSNGKYDISYVQVIADETSSNLLGGSGEYLSIGVTSDNKVALVWYDSINSCLKYSYNKAPTDIQSGKNKTNWSDPITIMEDAGEYCQLVVDSANGIHIAAYDGNSGDLKYAYLSSYDAGSASTCTVDSYAIVGQNITIDVAKNSSGKFVPYIGYYALSSGKPKYAYLVDGISSGELLSGVDESEAYTGVWECTLIPTSSKTEQDKINVGVWKDTAGKIANSKTGSSNSGTTSGKCYGNGTSNAVLGYAIKTSSTQGFIETAQMR